MIAEDRDVRHRVQSLWLMVWGQFTDHDVSHTALSKDVIHPSGQSPVVTLNRLRLTTYITNIICIFVLFSHFFPCFWHIFRLFRELRPLLNTLKLSYSRFCLFPFCTTLE